MGWKDFTDWAERISLGTVIWIASGLLLVALGIRKGWRGLKRFIATIDALAELPDKLPQIDKIVEIEKQVSEIHHEIRTNSGTSLKDAVVRIEGDMKKHLEWSHEYVSEQAERMNDFENTLNPKKETP